MPKNDWLGQVMRDTAGLERLTDDEIQTAVRAMLAALVSIAKADATVMIHAGDDDEHRFYLKAEQWLADELEQTSAVGDVHYETARQITEKWLAKRRERT